MNKMSISINCTPLIPIPERLQRIKSAGFDCVMLDTYNFSTEVFNNNVELTLLNGLIIDCVHMDYDNINDLWVLDGQLLVDNLSSQIRTIGKASIDKAILHISSSFDPPPISSIGLERLDLLRKIALDYNVTICFENLRIPSYIDSIISSIGSHGFGLCFDSGHENLYSKNQQIASSFAGRVPLLATHLHDNFGINDDHNLPFDGNINWKNVVKQLKYCNYKGAVNLEPMQLQSGIYKDTSPQSFICTAYNRLLSINQLLERE